MNSNSPEAFHAHMNLDAPEREMRFACAFEAAVKRTGVEFDGVVKNLSVKHRVVFNGK